MLTNLSKGQITKFSGKRWIFLGANKKEAFFANARKNSKYASYAPIYKGKVVFYGMTRMSVTPDEVCKAIGSRRVLARRGIQGQARQKGQRWTTNSAVCYTPAFGRGWQGCLSDRC